jgi:hypothetical protein
MDTHRRHKPPMGSDPKVGRCGARLKRSSRSVRLAGTLAPPGSRSSRRVLRLSHRMFYRLQFHILVFPCGPRGGDAVCQNGKPASARVVSIYSVLLWLPGSGTGLRFFALPCACLRLVARRCAENFEKTVDVFFKEQPLFQSATGVVRSTQGCAAGGLPWLAYLAPPGPWGTGCRILDARFLILDVREDERRQD